MKNQHGYYLTDQEFADLWQKFPSPTLMARETKTSARAILNRRRTVEIRLGINLEIGVDLRKEHNNKLKQERGKPSPIISKQCRLQTKARVYSRKR